MGFDSERRLGPFRIRLPHDLGRWKRRTLPLEARVVLESAVAALAVIGLVGVLHGGSSGTSHQTAAANSLKAQAPLSGVPSASPGAPSGSTPSPTPTAARPAADAPMPADQDSAGCQPLSNEGTCYEPGESCSSSDHGLTGVAGDGEQIVCQDNDGWRWEPVSAPNKPASDPPPSATPSPTASASPSPTAMPTASPSPTAAPDPSASASPPSGAEDGAG
jgi:hypothetical protein